jgi:hypothetical protein
VRNTNTTKGDKITVIKRVYIKTVAYTHTLSLLL